MMGCYRATFRLLERLGTRPLVRLQPKLRVEFRDPGGSSDVLASSSLAPPLNVLAGMLRLRRLPVRDRLMLLRVGLDLRLGGPRPDETVDRYLGRMRQSAGARRRLWDPIVIATLNTPPERASALLFARVMRLAFLGGESDSLLAFPTGGLSSLFDPAASYISERGGRVLTGSAVTGLEQTDSGYRITIKEGEEIVTRRMISALPQGMLRTLWRVGPLPTWLTAPLPTAPIVSLYLWYDREPGLPPFCAMLGTNVQWVFNRRKIAPGDNPRFPGLLSCTISAAFEESAADAATVVETAERELRSAFPEMRGARLLDSQVIKEKQATFAATPEAEPLRARSVTSLPGFFLAGDWTATGLPGTIEGAVQSGYMAAGALIASIDIPRA